MLDFQQKLKNYAHLIAGHGVNIQKGQMVMIHCETLHRDLALLLAEEAYNRGALYVDVDYVEPKSKRLRLQKTDLEALKFCPGYINAKYREMVDSGGANISLVGEEEPELFADLDPKKINTARMAQYQAVKYFYDEGIGKSRVHWTVAAAATPKWATKIFPGKDPAQAEKLLWDEIFKICRVDRPDFMKVWDEHQMKLTKRARALTDLGLKSLHFKGPGTDLTVGLSEKAIFKGGGETSTRGVMFEPNLPTEECFTTPDWRKTNGTVRTTRPFTINGVLIQGLEAEFKDGEIVSFKCAQGEKTFAEYTQSDAGAKRLGEVALVGIDSPVYASGLIFNEILYDENAACHIAIGSAYHFCLKDGPKLPASEREALGCNESSVHTDMMISSEDVSCIGRTYNAKEIVLIKNGRWQDLA